MRHTKIIATLGPATRTDEAIDALIAAGVDVFRLNFSHGSHAQHAEVFDRVRRSAARASRHVAILQDLSGPKIRTGRLTGGGPVELVVGQRLTIAIGEEAGTATRVSTTYAPLATAVSAGDRLLLDDGRIELLVLSSAAGAIETEIVDGGPLGEHKGINAPNVPLPAVGVTEKDAEDLAFGLALGVDLVALSFVQSAGDLWRARQLAERAGRPDVPLIAKIERPEAVARLEEVMAAADAVMVARGDLGLELPMAEVPRVQREILQMGRLRGVPVIVATQVLESMRTEMRPTRAEVSDAAGAVDGGADAIMLSGETAIGAHPTRAVQVLDSIIRAAESIRLPSLAPPVTQGADHVPALCDAAVMLANQGHAEALVAVTRKGRTARLLSARRPHALIYAATEREEIARRLALWRSVVPLTATIEGDVDEVAASLVDRIRERGLPAGSTVVFVNASLDLTRANANFVRIKKV
ncbi:MAG: pyruvate kinase [Vicinamibacterales bacterium]|nr:pyruvate kinase [Vicinamibacterales bacterium]